MKADRWPVPIMLHLLGRIDQAALMSAAARDAKARKGQECEADFYVGARLVAEAKTAEGKALLEKARDECPRDFIEYGEALSALASLKP
jgi:lipoprotein NlpI